MKHFIAIILFSVASQVSAQFYTGGGVGYGKTQPPAPAADQAYITENISRSGPMGGLFAGYRYKWIGFEVGAMHLPEDHTTAYTWDYPKAAKVSPVGQPTTVYGTQDIFSRAVYARLNVYAPAIYGLTPYAFTGKTSVHNYNHETALYDGTENVDFKDSFTNKTVLHGLGVQGAITGKWSARLEYTRIPMATVEGHTRERDVSFTRLDVFYSF